MIANVLYSSFPNHRVCSFIMTEICTEFESETSTYLFDDLQTNTALIYSASTLSLYISFVTIAVLNINLDLFYKFVKK